MSLRFRNTLGGELEPFQPLEAGKVGLYSCGPTVYGPAHVGNFRSFVFADLLRRYLLWSGYSVTWVMNVTDVDDKLIRRAAAEGVSIKELADRYAERFEADMRLLDIAPPDVMPRATEHIDDMVMLIERLLERGHAYRTDDGSVFFRIDSWPAYGRLARLDPEQQRVGERVEADEYGKDDVRDFALWKGPKPAEPSWSTAIGEGRPGWHIECSAMSMKYLGASFDIHTGGIDLVFPHHEDEMAQSEAATGQRFVSVWLHCAHLRMGGQKMAKRTGNFAVPDDVYAEGISPRVLRYALLSTHYRTGPDFTEAALATAASSVERLATVLLALDAYRQERADDASLAELLEGTREAFRGHMDDDLNVAPALGAIFDLVRELNRRLADRALSTADAALAASALRDLDSVLGVAEDPTAPQADRAVQRLLDLRVAARAERDWARSDGLRAELAELGVTVEDTADGQRWRRSTEPVHG
ncbi:MAG: cysteine--tRNA ligase [Chloroflexi bacterium]|nr:cysteine--tRNA ligase [Chloroflexota bacterium]